MRQVRDVAIFGVGGFGREVLTLINDINTQEEMWHVVGFFDDGFPVGYKVRGVKILMGLMNSIPGEHNCRSLLRLVRHELENHYKSC